MSKVIHTEEYKNLIIEINATYDDLYYDWNEGWTKVVKLHYIVKNKDNNVIKSSTDPEVTAKKKSHKFLFWTIKPKRTFHEEVQRDVDWMVDFIKQEIDRDEYEKEITDGLMDSIKGL